MYDAIIVGARCAGSPTAMLLARKGYRVLLVDRATFPSDMVLSTHLVWQSGMARLKRWGLLDRVVASGCPPITQISFDVGPFTLAGCLPPADGAAEAYSPRRTVLDAILVETAVAAGAELREGCVVDEIVTENDRVTGIRGRGRGGARFTEKAGVVIGADGMHSMVARSVQAPEYHRKPPLMGTYFTYWRGVPVTGMEAHQRDHRLVYAWLTNDELALVGVNWAITDFPAVRGDIEGNYFQVLDQAAPELAERLRRGVREAKWIGGSVPNFFRKPYGPGWALVGDAGYHKDPITAQGISDAFRDAERLADAIDAGFAERRPLDEALAEYEHQRNAAVMPMYEFTCQLAALEPPPPEMQQLFAALRGNQAQIDRFLGAFAGTVPLPEFLSAENIEQIMTAAGGAATTAS